VAQVLALGLAAGPHAKILLDAPGHHVEATDFYMAQGALRQDMQRLDGSSALYTPRGASLIKAIQRFHPSEVRQYLLTSPASINIEPTGLELHEESGILLMSEQIHLTEEGKQRLASQEWPKELDPILGQNLFKRYVSGYVDWIAEGSLKDDSKSSYDSSLQERANDGS